MYMMIFRVFGVFRVFWVFRVFVVFGILVVLKVLGSLGLVKLLGALVGACRNTWNFGTSETRGTLELEEFGIL